MLAQSENNGAGQTLFARYTLAVRTAKPGDLSLNETLGTCRSSQKGLLNFLFPAALARLEGRSMTQKKTFLS